MANTNYQITLNDGSSIQFEKEDSEIAEEKLAKYYELFLKKQHGIDLTEKETQEINDLIFSSIPKLKIVQKSKTITLNIESFEIDSIREFILNSLNSIFNEKLKTFEQVYSQSNIENRLPQKVKSRTYDKLFDPNAENQES